MVHRRDKFRGEKILQQRVLEKDNITIHWDHVLDEVLGDEMGVTDADKTHRIKKEPRARLAGCLHRHRAYNTEIFEGQLSMKNGYIQIQSGLHGNVTATNIPGIFAAGDVADRWSPGRNLGRIWLHGSLDAEKYLDEITDA